MSAERTRERKHERHARVYLCDLCLRENHACRWVRRQFFKNYEHVRGRALVHLGARWPPHRKLY
eukprot:6192107-Pleurochrysis_carterae.AAC.3